MNSHTVPLLRDFSDRLSPMVVKELRHGLRTRLFTSILIVFQLGMILLTSTVLLGAPMEVISSLFWSLSLLAILGALPLRGFNALTSEAQGGTLDMLRLTSIPAFRIVWGKWLALFSQVLLLACSLLPYMVARYQFGGVEMGQEGLALFLAVVVSGIATAAYVALSSQRALILRLFLSAGVLLMLIPPTVFIFTLTSGIDGGQVLQSLKDLSWIEQCGFLGGGIIIAGYSIFTLLALAASRIASISENHSTWKRKVHLCMMGLLVATGCALVFHPEEEAAMWALIPAFILTMFIGMDVMTEDMPHFPSVIQGVRLPRWMARILYPGWASGVLFYSGMMLLVLGGLSLHAYHFEWYDSIRNFFPLFCLAVIPLVPVCVPLNKNNLTANWCSVQIVLGITGFLLATFVGISRVREMAYIGTLTPQTGLIVSFENYMYRDNLLQTTLTIGGLWFIGAWVRAILAGRTYSMLENLIEIIQDKPQPMEPALAPTES